MSAARFAGKRAVVTGAGSGIGRAAAMRLCDEGADVLGVDLDAAALEETFRDWPSGRGRALDITRRDALDELSELGGADVLVNAAGILRRHPVVEHPADAWNATLTVNVKAPFRLAREFARTHLDGRRRGGAIVNVCSIESFTGAAHHAAYTASKTALLMATRSFALELAPHGIRVNGIAPGITETGMNQDLRADPLRAAELLDGIPMGRFGKASEQAAAICFLASDEAAYVTGAVLAVDGGWLSK